MRIYKGDALRRGRFSQREGIYIITSVTDQRQALFTDFFTARLLVNEFRRMEQDGAVDSLCWVIMPDHFHWLLRLRTGNLASVLRQLKSRSARVINKHQQRSGKCWQAGYHDRALRKDEDLKMAARYIVANPLRAGLVQQIGDYALWDAVWL